jgi:hypothetical protein
MADQKYVRIINPAALQQGPSRFVRMYRFGCTLVLLVFCFIWLWASFRQLLAPHRIATSKPSLEAHIMSKCPDAADCLRDLIVPTLIEVEDKVDFKLSYIGNATEEDDGVSCMHGPSECLGNMLELCAAYHYPNPKIYLGFTLCLFKNYRRIPQQDYVEDCALEHGISFSTLNKCVTATADDDGVGLDLLRDSVQRSAAFGVTTSCTVRLNDKIYCVRDGGEWKDCPQGHKPEDLILAIKKSS